MASKQPGKGKPPKEEEIDEDQRAVRITLYGKQLWKPGVTEEDKSTWFEEEQHWKSEQAQRELEKAEVGGKKESKKDTPPNPPPKVPSYLNEPFFVVTIPGETEPRETAQLTSMEFRTDLTPFRFTVTKETIQQYCGQPWEIKVMAKELITHETDVPPEEVAEPTKLVKGKKGGKDKPEDKKKPPKEIANKKDKGKKKEQNNLPSSRDIVSHTFTVSLANLALREPSDTIKMCACGDDDTKIKNRQQVTGFSELFVKVEVADLADKGPLITEQQVEEWVPMVASLLTVTDLADNQAIKAAQNMKLQAPDYSDLAEECEGVYLQYQLLPGLPVIRTDHYNHARNIGVYHKQLLLLSDASCGLLTPPPGVQPSSCPLHILQHWFTNKLTVEVHDRDRKPAAVSQVVEQGAPQVETTGHSSGAQHYGYSEVSLTSLINGEVLFKASEQIIPNRPRIDKEEEEHTQVKAMKTEDMAALINFETTQTTATESRPNTDYSLGKSPRKGRSPRAGKRGDKSPQTPRSTTGSTTEKSQTTSAPKKKHRDDRYIGMGHYLEWCSTVTMKFKLAVPVPAVSFVIPPDRCLPLPADLMELLASRVQGDHSPSPEPVDSRKQSQISLYRAMLGRGASQFSESPGTSVDRPTSSGTFGLGARTSADLAPSPIPSLPAFEPPPGTEGAPDPLGPLTVITVIMPYDVRPDVLQALLRAVVETPKAVDKIDDVHPSPPLSYLQLPPEVEEEDKDQKLRGAPKPKADKSTKGKEKPEKGNLKKEEEKKDITVGKTKGGKDGKGAKGGKGQKPEKSAKELEEEALKKAEEEKDMGLTAEQREKRERLERRTALRANRTRPGRGSLKVVASDTVSGFEVLDGEYRIWIIEGLAHSSMVDCYEALTSVVTSPQEVRIIFNKEISVPKRQYAGWPSMLKGYAASNPTTGDHTAAGQPQQQQITEQHENRGSVDQTPPPITKKPKGAKKDNKDKPKEKEKLDEHRQSVEDTGTVATGGEEIGTEVGMRRLGEEDVGGVGGRIRRIKLTRTLRSIQTELSNYVKRKLSDRVLRCVEKLLRLTTSKYMREIVDGHLFPTPAMLVELERIYGGTLTNQDQSGSIHNIIIQGHAQEAVKPSEAAEKAFDKPPKTVERHDSISMYSRKIESRNKLVGNLMEEMQRKPHAISDLEHWLNQDVILEGSVCGPKLLATLPSPASFINVKGPKIWFDVAALGGQIVLLLGDVEIPRKTIKYIVEGQLVSSEYHPAHPPQDTTTQPCTVYCIQVYNWKELVGGKNNDKSNPAFAAAKRVQKRKAPPQAYQKEMAMRTEARDNQHRKREVLPDDDSSGSEPEYTGDENAVGISKPRPQMDVQTNFVLTNKLKYHSPGSTKVRQREQELMKQYEGEIFNYSSQKCNVTVHQRQKIHDTSAQNQDTVYLYGNQVVGPVDEDSLKENRAKEEAKHKRAFGNMASKTAMDDNIHPKKPCQQRVEDLQQPWEAPKPAFLREKSRNDFNLLGKPEGVFVDKFDSVFAAEWGLGRAKEEALRKERERQQWMDKVVVKDLTFRVSNRSANRTKTHELDKAKSMLHGPPQKLSLKKTAVPPLMGRLHPPEKFTQNHAFDVQKAKESEIEPSKWKTSFYYATLKGGPESRRTIDPLHSSEMRGPLWANKTL